MPYVLCPTEAETSPYSSYETFTAHYSQHFFFCTSITPKSIQTTHTSKQQVVPCFEETLFTPCILLLKAWLLQQHKSVVPNFFLAPNMFKRLGMTATQWFLASMNVKDKKFVRVTFEKSDQAKKNCLRSVAFFWIRCSNLGANPHEYLWGRRQNCRRLGRLRGFGLVTQKMFDFFTKLVF